MQKPLFSHQKLKRKGKKGKCKPILAYFLQYEKKMEYLFLNTNVRNRI